MALDIEKVISTKTLGIVTEISNNLELQSYGQERWRYIYLSDLSGRHFKTTLDIKNDKYRSFRDYYEHLKSLDDMSLGDRHFDKTLANDLD